MGEIEGQCVALKMTFTIIEACVLFQIQLHFFTREMRQFRQAHDKGLGKGDIILNQFLYKNNSIEYEPQVF